MTQTNDITISFTGLMGTRYTDPSTPVIIENAGAKGRSFKTSEFLRTHGKFMQSTLVGRGYSVWTIEQSRVAKFIECAAKHGLVAGWKH